MFRNLYQRWRRMLSFGFVPEHCPRRSPAVQVCLEELEPRLVFSSDLSAGKQQLPQSFGQVPLSFERNAGQTSAQVQYLARGNGYTLFLTRTGAVLSLRSTPADKSSSLVTPTTSSASSPNVDLAMSLIGANPQALVSGLDPQAGISNYLIGKDPSQWHTNVSTYAQVRYQGVYPGVDLVYYGNQQQLEYDFAVAPNASPGVIQLAFQGAQAVTLDSQGDVVLQTAGGDVVERAPVVYQENGGVRQDVAGRYVLEANGQIGFAVAAYDSTRELIIDPVLSYSSYLGDNGNTSGWGVAVDSAGEAYVFGTTTSPGFPTTPGVYQETDPGSAPCLFIAKLNASGSALLYSTYLGGTTGDEPIAGGIAVDAYGSAYLTGETASPDFPTTPGAFQTVFAGNDAFVAKLSSSGTTLYYSTLLNGNGNSIGEGIAVDTMGDAYVTGETKATNLPTTPGAAQPRFGGGSEDSFVAEVDSIGTGLTYLTYLGGSGNEDGGEPDSKIAIDSSGNAYVTGMTLSSNFPTTPGALQTQLLGAEDAFVTKVNADGTAFVYSTYLGGTGINYSTGIAVDGAGNAYIAGTTNAPDFPTLNPVQANNAGGFEAFVTKLNPQGTALVWSTLLGGSGDENTITGTGGGPSSGIGSIALDRSDNVFVSGSTTSADFPTFNALQSTFGGGAHDAFVTALDSSGATVLFSSYLGGSGDDWANCIALDSSGSAYIAGYTTSSDFPTSAGSFQTNYGVPGGSEAFVAKLVISGLGVGPLTLPAATQGASYRETMAANGGTAPYSFTVTSGSLPAGLALSSSGVLSGSLTTPDTYHFTVTATDALGAHAQQKYTVTINPAADATRLVGWWRGEDNALDSAGSDNGTIEGGVTFAPGQMGQAFQLNGTDATIDVGNSPSLQVSSSDFTVGAWVNFAALAGDMSMVDKISLATGSDTPNVDGWRLIKQADNHFWFGFGGGPGINGLTPSAPTTVISQTTATTGQWYYVVGVKSASAFAVYVNGVQETAKSLVPFVDSNSADLLLGSNAREGSHLNGLLDEVMLFNRALSPSEIDAIYMAGLEGHPYLTITTSSLANGTQSQPGYSQTIDATGGSGVLTFSEVGALPAGLTLSSSGVLAGLPTAAGSFVFTVIAADAVGATSARTYSLTIAPASISQYLVNVVGSSSVSAGTGLLISVQAADALGNPVTSYSGPASVIASISPTSPGSTFPLTVPINGNGLGLFLATLDKVGTYTLTVAGGSFVGRSGPMTVVPGPAVKLSFASSPADTPTGDVLPPVNVQVEDRYGNVVTGDSSDSVTIGVGSGPGPGAPGFTADSTWTAPVRDGVVAFNNLKLVVPGAYQLSALVPGLYTGPYSTPFKVLPLQVLAGSFAGTPSGFSLQFNAPFLVNSMTPVLFGQGFGTTAPVPSVTLTQTRDGSGNAVNNPVTGSLVLYPTRNSITFVATDTTLQADKGSPLLPDGTYTVILHSNAATDGFQASSSGGAFLDGLSSGVPGSGDFVATFTVAAVAAHDDVLWVPATADGPGQALRAPGRNLASDGYPIYLNDATGAVTSVQLTLNYDPSLLTVMGASGPGFALLSFTPGQVVLQYSGPALPAGMQTPIGFLIATVPSGTTASPTRYKATDLLHLSGMSLNNGAIPVASGDALHLAAYVGDSNGDGAYSADDAAKITRAALQKDSGFAAYPLVDPVIVADTDGVGFIPADAALQINEAGAGYPTANLPNPPIPSGVVFQVSAANTVPAPGTHTALHVMAVGTPQPVRQVVAPDWPALLEALEQPPLGPRLTRRRNIRI
jgi:hypothetical protein